ncbi:AraC family transcriptional regulator [Pseudohalocynthiibacter aestuariivivens]|uniref:Helix-turn-helix transcriptional regulator n=1 Tax=Roseovarius pelagicus TaxID=2980108 RepID=A0ABY6DDD6_9RHOB|nr:MULTISPECIES: helix-turn-helix transcriptional regulator [Rhodobacterales]QIE45322.1 AraC family transcriptional regulator [Pseudohalocynthiibacter aestuariivivens]UXX83208.1 helix-turn-helix transcriptional regulator [Roseovarius pelagicus]
MEIAPVETAARPVVGYAKDYPAGLLAEAHAHPKAQVIYAVSGVMQVETQEASYTIPPSTALFMPSDMVHSIYMDGPVAMRCLFMRDGVATRMQNTCKVISVTPLLRELIVAACLEPLDWDLKGRGHYITSLALDEIDRSDVLALSLPLPSDVRLRRVIDAIRQMPSSQRSLGEWADIAGASERTLARLFRKDTGLTFRQWRQHARMTAAMCALSVGESLTAAANLAGFQSQPAFGAAFRKIFGITPGQVKAMGGGGLNNGL